jgi:hypothetical protein
MLNKKFTYAWCLVHLKTREDINSGISLLTVCAPPAALSLARSLLPPALRVCVCARVRVPCCGDDARSPGDANGLGDASPPG